MVVAPPFTRSLPIIPLLCLGLLQTTACNQEPEEPTDSPELCTLPEATTLSLRLTSLGTQLLDAQNRPVVLRGVNAGGMSKLPPFIPFDFAESGRSGSASDPVFEVALVDYVAQAQAWGINVVRLPFSWEGVEPQQGSYDAVYVERYSSMVAAFGAVGIRVIVDFHQDVFARPYCGDGFPYWTLPEPIPETPWIDCAQWFMGYFASDDVHTAFDRFWDNTDGLQDHFKNMWRYMAQTLWEHDNVIGFEIMNEPGAGSADNEALFQKEILTPFYSDLAQVIQEAAPGALVFFDASGVDGTNAETGVEKPAGELLVFAPHFYDSTAFMGQDPGENPSYDEPIGRWQAYGELWQVPVIVGEFGVRVDHEFAPRYIRAVFNALDTHQLHGTLWHYSKTRDDWNSENMSIVTSNGEMTPVADELVRAYPAAVGGELVSFEFNRATLSGKLDFVAKKDSVTEIATPAALYPEGVHFEIDALDGCANWDTTTGTLRFKSIQDGATSIEFSPALNSN